MSLTQDLETSQDIPEDVIFPPSDLYSNEPQLESYFHLQQMLLLLKCLDWWWRDSLRDSFASRNDFFCAGNLTIYYSPRQSKSEDFRGPDFFVVLGTERKPRKSWVVWHEDGKYPNIIVEILSSSTAATDRGLKKQIYQNTFRTPDYFWFDPDSLEFAGFHLLDGEYQPLEPNPQGLLWSQQLQLYLGIHTRQLRFFTAEGELIPTPEEVALQETHRAERLAAKLRELNIDPDSI